MIVLKIKLAKKNNLQNLNTLRPIILCGGIGSRLWPLSRESLPKQFVPLINGENLLSLTIKRIKNLSSPICIANEEYRFLVNDLLDQDSNNLSEQHPSILLEPSVRNTAAAMASAVFMPSVNQSDLLLFLPSDHYVPDINKFLATIESGINAALAGYIVTFGIQPSYPSTAYGYIQKGTALDFKNDNGILVHGVNRFIEKPTIDKAEEMLLSGNYFWNAGIFLCKASVLMEALSKHAPDIFNSCLEAMKLAKSDGNFIRPNKDIFLACRSESFDYAVMEYLENVAVIPFNGIWSDVGSWNAVAALSESDEFGNRINGKGMAAHSKNTFINAPHRPVVALGTENLVIVDTLDAVLVASVDRVEQVKDIVARLKKENISEAVKHRRVARPWGWFDSIDMGDCFQVKRIIVKPGASLSLQMHHHRAEHWIVVKGTAKVTNGDKIFLLNENQSTYIPVGVKHRLENPTETDLEMIEVQSGTYLGEDDIVRFDDTYGRI
jgi:mannose-1-phosphate guanylyltransferase / mannose-6-phosphate isomerase